MIYDVECDQRWLIVLKHQLIDHRNYKTEEALTILSLG